MPSRTLHPGLSAEAAYVVGDADTATVVGSGSLPVLATPRLVGWLEAATCSAIDGSIPEGSSSVGTRVALEHLLPSPVGAEVRCTATLVDVDGRLLLFETAAMDAHGRVVARGQVTRVVVDSARFLARATSD